MSEQQEGPQVEGFGDYHPEAAGHRPYNDAMAAWRNQVKAMQGAGALPPTQTPQEEPLQEPERADAESNSARLNRESVERLEERQQGSETPEDEPRTTLQGDSESGMQEVPAPQPDPAEQGDSDAEPGEVFDPAEHNAPEVLGYLRGVGEDEAVRVLESEEAGKARKGILNLKDDILVRARENDETDSGSKEV